MPILIGTIFGAIIGSFIATIVLRWPRGLSVATGRSACDGCGAPIASGDLVPIVSYLVQAGKARCCGAAIDRVHPLAEILAATIGALAFAIPPDLQVAAAGAIFGWLLLTLALLDARHFWLPDPLTILLALAGLAAGALGLSPDLSDRLIGGAAAWAAFAAIRFGYRALRGREGMGGGDVKLFGAVGLWLGWRMLAPVLLGAAVAGLCWVLVQYARGRSMSGLSSIPFGCFLALAAWGGWVAMQIDWLMLPI